MRKAYTVVRNQIRKAKESQYYGCYSFAIFTANQSTNRIDGARGWNGCSLGYSSGHWISLVRVAQVLLSGDSAQNPCSGHFECKVGAMVFIPDGNEPLPGIVFSHSAIHGPNNNTDLLRFAWALARAGAASIVLERVIDWQSGPNDDSIRPPEFQFCAGQWLLQHVNIDLTRAADAGNHEIGWIENDVSQCGVDVESGKARCWPGGLWLDFGQIGHAESRNTDSMLTLEGQLWMAQFAQKYLKLKEIEPEWLTETVPVQLEMEKAFPH